MILIDVANSVYLPITAAIVYAITTAVCANPSRGIVIAAFQVKEQDFHDAVIFSEGQKGQPKETGNSYRYPKPKRRSEK